MSVYRLPNNPIVTQDMPGGDPDILSNINGPSLIRAPDWLPNRLGNYYLYFAHHQGKHIRLAYADSLEGEWTLYTPGTLQVDESLFTNHIASPDVHVDEINRRLLMYYHGVVPMDQRSSITPEIDEYFFISQRTRLAFSDDGLNFKPQPEMITSGYLRAFRFKGMVYGVTMPGLLYRSPDGINDFEAGPVLFGDRDNPEATFFSADGKNPRHFAVKVEDDTHFRLYFSLAHDTPETIMTSLVDARSDDWRDWQPSTPEAVLYPEEVYEGVDLPLEASQRGAIHTRVRQLRDPGIFVEDGVTYLLYSTAGEYGIAIARLD